MNESTTDQMPVTLFPKKDCPAVPFDAAAKADTFDPNYQTLNNMDDPFAAKGAAGGQGPAAPTDATKKADTFDPQYQTLNAVPDAFGNNKPAGGGGNQSAVAPQDAQAKVSSFLSLFLNLTVFLLGWNL